MKTSHRLRRLAQIILISHISILTSPICSAQNVGVNSTGATPNASAKLDLNTGNTFTSPNGKGLLVPNVALTSITDAVTVNTPATSLFVYNTATAGVSPNNVIPGFYYWNGVKWVAFEGPGSNNWALLGNAGTTVGTNFLGTTDNQDLEFKVNNNRSGLIDIANYQTFYGYEAGLNTTAAGQLNSFFGYQAGSTNTSGISNTGIGYNAINTNTTGNYNTAMGVQTLATTTGNNNSALGVNSGYSISSGSNNTALGYYAMNNFPAAAITGSNNTAVGNNAGTNMTSGSYNTLLGYNSFLSTGTYTNATGVGSYSYPGADNVLVLGSIAGKNGAASSAHVGIGNNTPADALVVNIPTGSAINAITSDVTAGNGNGNALNAAGNGLPGISTIYGTSTPTSNGTGFDITFSNHTIGASINLSAANCNYAFAVHGEVQQAQSEPSAGVIGLNSHLGVWGALGYRTIGSVNYGGYFDASQTSGTGRMSSAAGQSDLSNIGIGAYGDLFGAVVKGSVYGMTVSGARVSLYVDGKTVVNQPIAEVTRTSDNQTMVNYTSVSATPVLQLNGTARMNNGVAVITIDRESLNQYANTEDLTIIATPAGQTNGVYAELSGNELTIKENNGGTSTTKVSWIIVGQRNVQNTALPDEVKATNFDTNLGGFMHSENDKTTPSTGLYWDGNKLNTGVSPTAKRKH